MKNAPKPPIARNWVRPFFTLWAGQAISLLGSQLVQFALIWWLTKTTGSATILATSALVGLLPQVFLLPIAGTLVDRWSRRVTMIIADSLIAVATLGLVILFWTGEIQIWHIYLLMFVRAAAGSFHWPAMQASTSLMVPDEHLSRVQGVNQMLNGGLNIISAPLGALLLEVMTVRGVLMIDIGTAILAILPLFFIYVPQPRTASNPLSQHSSVWQDFRIGLKYALSWPGLVIIGVMATMINFLLAPAGSLVPILVTKHFGGQALQLAWMESAMGIGVLLGGLLLGVWGGFQRRIYTSVLGLFGIAFGSFLIGVLPGSAFPLAIAGMFATGFAMPITNGPLHAALQAVVAPDMQGRIFTLLASVASAISPIGLLIAGPVADAYGVQTWFVLGGLVTAIMALSMLFIPAVLHFEDGTSHEDAKQDLVPVPVPIDGD